ncbi:hypothetical protein LCGC14_0725530 [marine sediment metagenome]|uniref:Right handed beta helix domain-containing protein n=1 Tax=marine sediment metagenome TaxID=412755 RepID=A0A0F9QW37_9ZZZZ
MTLTNFPNGITSFGIPMVGSSDLTTTGNIFFVDSGNTARGDTPDKGSAPDTPFSTIDFAVGRCTANNGDVIFVMPGHAENISTATSLVMDVAGVRIIGMGWGRSRPVLTYTATGSTVEMDAANCTLENIVFVAGISAVVVGINVDAADCSLVNCEFDFSTTAFDFVTIMNIATVDRAAVLNCRFITENGVAGTATGINLNSADEVQIIGNRFIGDFTNGCIRMTGVASDSVEIRDNRMWNGSATARGISNLVGSNGIIRDNTFSYEDDQAHANQLFVAASGSTLNWQITVHRSSVFDGGTTNSHGDLAGTNDPYTIFTVTGDVIIEAIWGICNTDLTGASATISVGVVGRTAGLIALETATEIDDGNVYVSATQAVGVAAISNTGLFAINDSLDIIETPLTANVTGGQIDYYCIWAPAEDGASIIAAAAVT